MMVLHCTRKLLDRLPAMPKAEHSGGGALRSWYATLLIARPAHLVLLVHEESRLPVLLPAAPLRTLLERIPGAVAEVLAAIGLETFIVARERAAVAPITVAGTESRSVLGTMNDFIFHLAAIPPGEAGTLLKRSLWLADTPVSPLKYEHPGAVVKRILMGQISRD